MQMNKKGINYMYSYQDKSHYFLKTIALITGVILISSMTLAQTCMPADFNCTEFVPANDPGLNRALETPPQLAIDEATPGILATDVIGSSTGLVISSGTPLWGAVAKDFDMLGVQGLGVSNNWPSEMEAAQAAVWLCMDNGGKNCFVDITYSNRCLSIAQSDAGQVYWAIGVTTDHAAQATQVGCSQKYGMACQVIYAGCSYPAP